MAVPDDRSAIEGLIFAYAERIDAGDFAAVAELFANGGILAAPGMSIEGSTAVAALYERTTRRYEDGTPRTKHVTTNVVIDLDGEGAATARSYFTVFQQTDELPLQAIIAGRYHDTFHLVADEWCFDVREMLVDLTGDLSHHLLIEL